MNCLQIKIVDFNKIIKNIYIKIVENYIFKYSWRFWDYKYRLK